MTYRIGLRTDPHRIFQDLSICIGYSPLWATPAMHFIWLARMTWARYSEPSDLCIAGVAVGGVGRRVPEPDARHFPGGVSGLIGGWVDNIIQRLIEILRSIPDIPLWMALATAVPPRWDPVVVYFGITVILSLLRWTDMARVVRGKFLSLREEDFITAAELDGVPYSRIIIAAHDPVVYEPYHRLGDIGDPRHDLGRNGARFPRTGIASPPVSWGVMLQDAI